MKFKIAMLALIMNTAAFSSTSMTLQVPFNVGLEGSKAIYANYHFDPNKQVLVCGVTTGGGTIDWNYKGYQYTKSLDQYNPSIRLKGDSIDTSGQLTLYASNGAYTAVNCWYGII